jgi:hypothetical protein
MNINSSLTNPLQAIRRNAFSGFGELIKLFRLFSHKTSKFTENQPELANPLNIGQFLSFGRQS